MLMCAPHRKPAQVDGVGFSFVLPHLSPGVTAGCNHHTFAFCQSCVRLWDDTGQALTIAWPVLSRCGKGCQVRASLDHQLIITDLGPYQIDAVAVIGISCLVSPPHNLNFIQLPGCVERNGARAAGL